MTESAKRITSEMEKYIHRDGNKVEDQSPCFICLLSVLMCFMQGLKEYTIV